MACALTIGWGATGPLFDWSDSHSLVINTITTVLTFLMVFVLQHSQNHGTAAIQAKLDELIRSSDASNEMIRAEQKTDEEVENLRP